MDRTLQILKLLYIYVLVLQLEILLAKRKSILVRRWWVKPHLKNHIRNTFGGFQLICQFYKINDTEEFKKFFGFSIHEYEVLLNLIKETLKKRNDGPRKPLPAEMRLAIVLSFLHHGGNPRFFAHFYKIGLSTIYELINEVCAAIRKNLLPIYFPPLTKDKWLEIAFGFNKLWNVPNCLGALDGKHFRVKKPPNSGSIFYNYKHFFSTVLMATCDAYRRFTWFNFGEYGSSNDASIFNNSDLCEKMHNNDLDIPQSNLLPQSNLKMPYFFIGDNIFALQKHLMKSYNRIGNLTYIQKIFNYRITRGRINIECAFGLLTAAWAVLQKPHGFKLKTFENIVIALLCLHNMTITMAMAEEEEEENLNNSEEENQNDLEDNEERGHVLRDRLANYFISEEGRVPWQDQYI